ncbi:signal recognition particle-docking protein FtsY, partial [Mycolicibacter terrae]
MTEGLWIAIAVAAALVVIAALIFGLLRHRRRRISLSAPQRESLDRSGGYAASSDITFSRTEPPAPVIGDDATEPR